MAAKGTKEKCPKGMAKQIVAKAMATHPQWNARQISENYPVGESTAHKHMKDIRDEQVDPKRIYEQAKSEERETANKMLEQPKDYLDQKLEEQANSSITEGQKESNRLMFVAGTLFGVVLTMGFYLLNQAGV